MSIIKKESPDKYFVGVLFTPHIFKYLSLYVLAKRTDKSKIIRGQMEAWIREQQQENNTERKLMDELVEIICSEWSARKSGPTVVTFGNFRKETEYELIDKGIDKEYIQIILNELDQNEASKKTRISR